MNVQLASLPHRFLPCTAVNRPQLFTLFHSAMSGEKLRLMCLVWPDDKPDEHIVEVEVNNDRTVAALKKLIKDEYAPRLDKIAAPDLILWKCSIPADDNLQETLNSIHFDAADTRLHRLPPASLLTKHFATGLSPETIHILVEVSALGECGTRISCSMLKGLVSSVQPGQGEHE